METPMSDISQTATPIGPNDRDGNVVLAHVIERRRKERDESIKQITSTILGQAITEGAAAQ
jgi:hypothetical protein